MSSCARGHLLRLRVSPYLPHPHHNPNPNPSPNPSPDPNPKPDPYLYANPHPNPHPNPTRCARPPGRVRAAKAKWEGRHDASLVDHFDSELSGHFQVRELGLGKPV